jgi:hypothetical protein
MPLIKRECIEHIREVADLYDIVSGYVQLRRSGANWKGLSPFTVEKTPLFFVLPEPFFQMLQHRLRRRYFPFFGIEGKFVFY